VRKDKLDKAIEALTKIKNCDIETNDKVLTYEAMIVLATQALTAIG